MQAVIGVIEDGQKRGEFSRLLDPRTTTLALIGSLNWLTHWYHPDGELKGAEFADNFCDIFLSACSAGRARQGRAAPTRSAARVG